MYKKELKEYIQLISEANVSKRVEHSFNTIYHEDGIEEGDVKETNIYIYNGYEDVEIYAFKLASISYYLEKMSQYNSEYCNEIDIEVNKLISLFDVQKEYMFHRNFINMEDDPESDYQTICQSDVRGFIIVAYMDVNKLLDNISSSISSIIIGNEQRKKEVFKLIKQALIDLGITDENGLSLKVKKGKLWAFIDILLENKMITPLAELKMISLLWNFIKANGSPPTRNHRHMNVYKKAMSDFREYFEKCQKMSN